MTAVIFHDAYTDKPRTQRAQLEERIRQLKAQYWSDPSDGDLRLLLAEAEAELAGLDRVSSGGAS